MVEVNRNTAQGFEKYVAEHWQMMDLKENHNIFESAYRSLAKHDVLKFNTEFD